jgi:flavin-dependent dehydrogenase
MRRGSFDLRGALARYLEMHLGPSAQRDIVSIEHHGYVIPVSPRRGGFALGRVLLAGDAAGLADPLTGEGISYAIESGRLAAWAVLDANFEARAVRTRYRDSLRASMLPELFVARGLAHVLYRRPAIAARLFERAGQRLCEAMTDVVCGTRSYRELALDPRNYWKLVAQR